MVKNKSMELLKIEDYRDHYNQYFVEFNRLAVGEYADLSYGSDKPNPTASSLESIIAYANYIFNENSGTSVTKLLNAGAGASSFMFREIFNGVMCIDSHSKYLELVEKVCKTQQAGNWSIKSGFGNSFASVQNRRFDHVYFDYGDIERLPFLGYAIELATKSVYVDDSDCRDECMPYRNHVIDLCKAMGLKYFDCLDAKDEHGRWGIIIEK